jgi:hypothetical protein
MATCHLVLIIGGTWKAAALAEKIVRDLERKNT